MEASRRLRWPSLESLLPVGAPFQISTRRRSTRQAWLRSPPPVPESSWPRRLHRVSKFLEVSRVVIIGDADPLGGSFRSFGPISLNDVGDVGFTPGSGAGAIYSASPNIVGGYDVRLVDLSPFVVCDSRLSLNNSHQVAFLGGNSSGGCGAPNYVIGLSSPNGTQGVAYYSNPPFILHF